jgi:hypothetical protein
MSDFPYPGLRPFTQAEADIFFGREEQIDLLLEKLAHTRFISVLGLSGCGKSSLVRAGLIPALKTGYMADAGPHWRVATMRPGNHPLQNLAHALLTEVVSGSECAIPDAESLAQWITAQGALGLADLFRQNPLPGRTNLLLLVDQFEEIFRYHRTADRDEAEAFVGLLLTSAEQRGVPIYVVLTMRADFIGDCALFRGLPEIMNTGQFLTPRLTREQLRKVMLGPAKVFGGTVEPRLVNQLLDTMGADPDQLPLLQHCLMRIWLHAVERTASPAETPPSNLMITLADYESVGGLENALSNHADEALQALPSQEQQVVAEKLFRCLSERGPDQRDIRRPAMLQEVAREIGVSVREVIEVVDVFRHPEQCFIMPPAGVPITEDTILDISHESLIRQWQRMRLWVNQEAEAADTYRHLERTALAWQHGQAALWSTPDLDIALRWKAQEQPTAAWSSRYGNHFDLALEFLDASKHAEEEREQQRRQEEKRRQEEQSREEKRQHEEHERQLKLKHARQGLIGAFVALVIVLVIVIGLGGWAIVERGKFEQANVELSQALKDTQKAQAKAETEKDRAENALQETEKQRQLAETETKAKEDALGFAEQKRIEAENAQKLAEEQTQMAVDAQKKAEEASQNFKELAETTFGFLSAFAQQQQFLEWVQSKQVTVEKLLPALKLIDQADGMDETQKQSWYAKLSSMNEKEIVSVLDTLGIEIIKKTKGNIYIRKIVIQDIKGVVLPFQEHGMFIDLALSAPKEKVKILVIIPPIDTVNVEADAVFGKADLNMQEITYTAPSKPGSEDIITVRVVNKATKEVIEQKLINVTVATVGD